MIRSTRLHAAVALVGMGWIWYTAQAGGDNTRQTGPPATGGLDYALPCEKEEIQAAPAPWEQLQQSMVLMDGGNDGPRVFAYAVAKSVYAAGEGPAYAVALEPDGRVAVYATYGTPDQVAAAYDSVRSGYILPDGNWTLVCHRQTVGDLLTWFATDTSGVGAEASELLNGGAAAGLRQWVTYPSNFGG